MYEIRYIFEQNLTQVRTAIFEKVLDPYQHYKLCSDTHNAISRFVLFWPIALLLAIYIAI